MRLKSHRWRSGEEGGRSGFSASETRDISMCVTSGISTAQGKAPLRPDARLKQTRAAAYQPTNVRLNPPALALTVLLCLPPTLPSLSTHQAASRLQEV